MDRAARRPRNRGGGGGESVAAAAPSSSRARRREKAAVVVIDLGDDEDDDDRGGGGGGGGGEADGAASRRGRSAADSGAPRVVPAGAVAMRTRSRRRAMEAAVAPPEEEEGAPRAKRRRKGAGADDAEASGGGRSKTAAASRSASREKRRASEPVSTSRVRSRRASEPARTGRTRSQRASEAATTVRARSRRTSEPAGNGRARKSKSKGKEPEPEAEAESRARAGRAEVSGVDGSDEDGGRGDDTLDDENGESGTGSANGIDLGSKDRRRVTVGDQIVQQRGNVEAIAPSLNHVTNEVVSGDPEGWQGGGDEGGRLDSGFAVDVSGACGHKELAPIGDAVDEETPPFEDDYDDEMLEEQLVGDVIRAYSNGGELDPDGVDWEAEDEMEFDDSDDSDFMDDADEGGMSEPMHDHADMEMQDLVDHKAVCGGVRREEEEETDIKSETESKGEEAPHIDQGTLHIEILDSDEEVKVVSNMNGAPSRKASVQGKLPIVPSCVAWRTRSLWGIKQDRLSYNTYFEALSDEPKEEDDDTEVELDEEDDSNDDDSSDRYDKDEEEKEEEEEEAERRKAKNLIDPSDDEEEAERRKVKNGIDASDDDIIASAVATSKHDLYWEEVEDPNVHIFHPVTFKKDGSSGSWQANNPVGNDMITEQQKRSRFTWDLERRKKLKLGIMKTHRLYERELNSDSNSSDSDQIRRHEIQKDGDHKVGTKKKYPPSKSGKKSSRTMQKRQSLLKLLIDKMSHDKNGESFQFDQNPQLEYTFREMHPLVFSFGDEDPVPADRPEQDVALDMLWAEFDFALESENIGTYYDDEGEEESNRLGFALASAAPCSRGKHEFIIDDQIGIRCKYCSLVNLEIKFMLPSLVSGSAEKPAWINASGTKDALMFHDLYEQAGSGPEQSQDFHLYGTVWDLIPGVITTMYEHQREAFEFMWTNLVGDIRLDELKHGAKPDVVGGCVICHAPGTGKTRLAIVFIQTYMKVFPDCRPVIIAPRGMLFAWDEEFKKWNVDVPFHIMNTTDYTGKEDRDICRLIKKEHRTEKLTRLVKLLSWNKGHGILGISYGLYTKLTSEKAGCTEENKVRSILLENPGLLVLDEGHTPRNERSVMWKTLGKVKTEKRIILSGTPFQNNFLELYNILCLVRPRFGEMFLTKARVGRRHHVSKKQRDKFSDKYEKGVWASLTSNVTDDNAEKVRSILKPFVHIHNGNILRTLPGLRESVIILKPPPLQKSIIRKVENIGSGNNFEHEYVISLASTHPSLVTAINMSEEEASLIDKPMLEKLRSNPYEGVKTRFVIEVVRLCEALREKVLIFSQFIQPLELIKEHLRKFFKWREGKEILQMDGKILPRYRQASIEAFNNPNNDSRVLLASTRACCEGISLTGASRVVLLDVVWNPAVGRQAISRAFRIGQKKFVYTYNLITYGTGEGDKYDRQAEKDHLSKLVFSTEDEFNNVRNMLSKAEMEHSSKLISEDKVLEEMTSHDQLKSMFLKIHYPPTESNIVYTYNQIAPELN